MSETQRTPFNRRVRYLCIAGAFVLLVLFRVSLDTPNPTTEIVTVKITPSPRHQRIHFQPSFPPLFPSDPFYRTIIDNNLFRPLGWTPPRPSEPYRLLGTIRFPTDANIPPKAILQTTAGNTTRIVTLGEKLDADTEVVNILQKQITLETNGQQRTLSLNADLWIQ